MTRWIWICCCWWCIILGFCFISTRSFLNWLNRQFGTRNLELNVWTLLRIMDWCRGRWWRNIWGIISPWTRKIHWLTGCGNMSTPVISQRDRGWTVQGIHCFVREQGKPSHFVFRIPYKRDSAAVGACDWNLCVIHAFNFQVINTPRSLSSENMNGTVEIVGGHEWSWAHVMEHYVRHEQADDDSKHKETDCEQCQ